MFYTDIEDRRLFFDGISSFNPDDIIKLHKKYDIKYVTHITKDIKNYNKLCSSNEQILVKEQCNPLQLDWSIPLEYQTLDVVEYAFNKHIQLTSTITSQQEIDDRDARLINELKLFIKLKYLDIIRLMIYIIEVLHKTNTVYGIGRGSAVSSYVLYVLGVHDVDSFLYDLDINDFIKGN